MKILIIGSLRPPENPGDEPKEPFVSANKTRFQAACQALGTALTRKGHLVMVGVPDWPSLQRNETVATFIIQGINKVALKDNKVPHPVIFYGPQQREPVDKTPSGIPDSLQELKKLQNIKIKDKFTGKGTSKARVIPNITEVDAVMLISGREGTETIGYAAYSLGKPVIAIRSFEGAAETITTEVLLEDYNRFIKQGGVTPDDLRSLEVDWEVDADKNLSKAEDIVNTCEKLVKAYGQSDRKTLSVLKWTIVGLVVLLLGWVATYLSANQCTTGSQFCTTFVMESFFLLLYITALLGSGLRTLVQYQQNQITYLTFLGLSIDAAISMLVAFGLALVYLIGGITFTGKVVVLDNNNASQNIAFTTVAISMSLVGLAAGYLVPIKELAKRLENVIAQQNK